MKKNDKINAFFSKKDASVEKTISNSNKITQSNATISTPVKSPPININFSTILQRDLIAAEISGILNAFESQCNNVTFKKGIYIYGSPGSGKTHFVVELLK